MLGAAFAGELFGPGQPLDATKYFIILPDAIGTGKSSKPSDGLRAKFPRYNYDDMVAGAVPARHRRARHRATCGSSSATRWAACTRGSGASTYPDFMDALVPMACQPTEMSARNWMMRRMLIDAVRKDPDWNGGDYTTQPRAVRTANAFWGIATNGGSQAYYKAAPTREKADKLLDDRLAAPFTRRRQRLPLPVGVLGRLQPARRGWSASAPRARDQLRRRRAQPAGARHHGARAASGSRARGCYLIPASEETRGHGTTGMASFWKEQLQELLAERAAAPAPEAPGRPARARRGKATAAPRAQRRLRDVEPSASASRGRGARCSISSQALRLLSTARRRAEPHDPAEAGQEVGARSGHQAAEHRDREQAGDARHRVVDARRHAGRGPARPRSSPWS